MIRNRLILTGVLSPLLVAGAGPRGSIDAIFEADGISARDLPAEVAKILDASGLAGDALARQRLHAGARHVERGQLEPAADLFRLGDLAGADARLRNAARHNLAQVRFRQATDLLNPGGAAPPDLSGVIARLRESASAFRAAIEADPADAESARNLERVRRMITQVEQARDEARRQEEKAEQQADELDQLAARQQAEAAQNQALNQVPQQARGDQDQISRETQRLREQMENQPADQEQQTPNPQDAMEAAEEAQRRAEDALARGEQQEAAEHQREAAEHLREAAQRLRDQAGSPSNQDDAQPENNPEQGDPGQDQPPTENEGESRDDRLTDWLFDRERRQREERDRQLRALIGRPAPVEKDW
jgi:tetratricopeptide (TPR) repeat protein